MIYLHEYVLNFICIPETCWGKLHRRLREKKIYTLHLNLYFIFYFLYFFRGEYSFEYGVSSKYKYYFL